MKIEIDIPDGESGNWRIESFTVKEDDLSQIISAFRTGRWVPGGNYKKLIRENRLVMSNTPDEIRDFIGFVYRAKGDVLVNGLGLGVTIKALLENPEVTEITVIEKSKDVIFLVAPLFSEKRVKIINADAFDYKPEKKYDFVWHDIWDSISIDNLPEMHRLHRKYGRKADYQESWCRYQCERERSNDNFY